MVASSDTVSIRTEGTVYELPSMYRTPYKVVHDSGFVHRDIKACNFMLGHTSDAKKARMVHILDFGLARYGRKL